MLLLACTQVQYNQLIVQPVQLLGWPLAAWPPLLVQLPTLAHGMAGAVAGHGAIGGSNLMTTYLDADTRVSRGQHGELYLFKRE
jgi:hypothetical protein